MSPAGRLALTASAAITCGACAVLATLDEHRQPDAADASIADGASDMPAADQSTSDGAIDSSPAKKYSEVVLADGPIAYFRLGDARGGGVMKDAVNAHDGTYGAGVDAGPGAIFNDLDLAADFRAATAPAAIGDVPSVRFVGGSSFTVEAWVNTDPPDGGASYIVAKLTGDASAGYAVGINPLSQLRGEVHGNGSAVIGNINTVVESGTYHHVVVVFEPTKMTAFVDTLPHLLALGTNQLGPTTAPFTIAGLTSDPRMFRGTIDEVALYDYAVPEVRVRAHYAAGAGHPPR
jgi:hypothetical protein